MLIDHRMVIDTKMFFSNSSDNPFIALKPRKIRNFIEKNFPRHFCSNNWYDYCNIVSLKFFKFFN
jgi:hypothetical protein